jgi:alkylation response protein AidB-like acyl-CoA dehydrogenase
MLAHSVRRFCERHNEDLEARAGDLQKLWRGLGEIGVFRVPRAEGGAEVCSAAAAVLGYFGFPGPIAQAMTAALLLEGDDLEAVESGTALVSLGSPPLMPFAPLAEVFIEIEAESAYRCRVVERSETLDTLAGEPWARCTLERTHELGDATAALALGNVTVASYLVGAGEHLLETAAGYATDRVQFGRPVGDFQSVAHPLADVALRLRSARTLARAAAHSLDVGNAQGAQGAATARLSATGAALQAAYRCHQTLGAMGFTVEGPVARLAQQARQVSMSAPGLSQVRETVAMSLRADGPHDSRKEHDD